MTRHASILLLLMLLAVSAASEGAVPRALVVDQTKPDFPKPELMRAREGWVIVTVDVDESGAVMGARVLDSSGSDHFDAAALHAVRSWRFLPGKPGQASALLNFVYERNNPQLREPFFFRNVKVHKAIDAGDLDRAETRLRTIRRKHDLNPFELAYTYITEARIADARGDKAAQLQCFRRAMINDGRWLDRNKYLDLLYAAVVLELQLEDLASAIRDYALLTETQAGRRRATDLEEPIAAARTLLASQGRESLPYVDADSTLTVVREALTRPRIPQPEPERPPPRPKPPPAKPR